eukprot:362896-Chlamydomonas_euryale.AAC.7
MMPVPQPAQLFDKQLGCDSITDGESNASLLLRAVAGDDRRSRPVFGPAQGDSPVCWRVHGTKEGGVQARNSGVGDAVSFEGSYDDPRC